ncbi:MAG: cobalamin biosynthesis protein CobD, partial [Spirochaetales bacterium]
MNAALAAGSVTRTAIVVLLALVLDAVAGDPSVRWHPVRLLGRLAAWMEIRTRRFFRATKVLRGGSYPGHHGRDPVIVAAGAITWMAVALCASLTALCLTAAAGFLHPALGIVTESLVIWVSIAPSDLATHANRVKRAILRDMAADRPEPIEGREAVAMIVGRDVSRLDYAGVARACVESVAESSIDGAAAPLFWAVALGPWAAFAYRAVNTMDSMFGHKDERYLSFGLVAARADDVANWLPARLSSAIACMLAPVAGGSIGGAFRSYLQWRNAHESPNAGHPEAAYAGVLGLRLGGPASYAEGVIDKPWMNPDGRKAIPEDISRAVRLMIAQTAISSA